MSRLLFVFAFVCLFCSSLALGAPSVNRTRVNGGNGTHTKRMIHPIIDGTGSDSFTPKVNLTRFKVQPTIIETIVQDEELRPVAPPVQPQIQPQPAPAAGTVSLVAQNTATTVTPTKTAATTTVKTVATPTVSTGNSTVTRIQVKSIKSTVTNAVNSAVAGAKAVGNAITAEWKKWMARFKRVYTAMESVRRMAIWTANKAKAVALNLLNAGQYTNNGPFGDMDADEFALRYLRARPVIAPGARSLIEAAAAYPADRREGEIFFETHADMEANNAAIDWRSISTPIKFQSDCGSCWAFSASATLESAWMKSGKKMQILSPQQLIDCNRDGNAACEGGNFANAFAYWQSHGSTTESAYPYKGVQATCKAANGSGPRVKTAGHALQQCMGGDCVGQQEESVIAQLRKYGPLAAIIDSTRMQLYEKGIIKSQSGCSKKWDKLNHAVVIVGYQPATATTGAYWVRHAHTARDAP